MEENQSLQQSDSVETFEPKQNFENSVVSKESEKTSQKELTEGQSSDPSELILGKFKSVDDLTKAYQELEKFHGTQANELGNLRQNAFLLNEISNAWKKEDELKMASKELIAATEKYNKPEYFQDPSFREIFKEAYLALGKNLDTDKLVNLIEGYVSSRIFAKEKAKAEQKETQDAINSISFEKNNKSSLAPPKKRLDEMTPQEVDDLLERII